MLKAGQNVVIQEANINLIAIRTAEVVYFSQFFSSFGTQCALIAGFIVNSVSQVPGYTFACIFSFFLHESVNLQRYLPIAAQYGRIYTGLQVL
jgi:hypothetical protein